MYLHRTENGHYTPPCCYFSGELEVVECLPQTFSGGMMVYGLKCAVKHSCYRGSKIQTLACVLSTAFHRMTGIYGKINYICLTDFNKKKLLELKQIKPERVFVKPNFIECKNEFIPEKDRKNQFVFAGRLDKLKGIDLLFEAWKRMGAHAPKLIVCGTGPMERLAD